jgi:hypothetical protein
VGHETHIGELRNAYKILVEKAERIAQLGDLGVDENIILKWILKKSGGRMWIACRIW